MENPKQVFVQMALNAFTSHVKRTETLIDSLTDDQLKRQIAPGKNRGVYLVGHLAAVHDMLPELLGIGERKYSHMDTAFVAEADKHDVELLPLAEVRKAWKESNSNLNSAIEKMKPEEWFMKHTKMTDEDLVKEPHRNRLSVLISRTDHLAYHLGQLMLLK